MGKELRACCSIHVRWLRFYPPCQAMATSLITPLVGSSLQPLIQLRTESERNNVHFGSVFTISGLGLGDEDIYE